MGVKTFHLETVIMKTFNFLDCLLKYQNIAVFFKFSPPHLLKQGKNKRETKLFATSDHSS